jgi:sn-glycerol 3-phosphate transport system substrate-binding protein
MLSMPFNSSSMVMWINKDALRRRGSTPTSRRRPGRRCSTRQEAEGRRHATCGFSTAWTTWANVEQLSAWHNVPLATKANGLDGFDTELKFNGPVQVKHLQTLVDLQKDKTFDYSGRTNAGEGRFTNGECPIFLTSSGFYGNVKGNAKFDWAAVPMPYYPDVQGAPQNSIIGGASLWVMGGKSAAEYKGIARFFTFLSDTDRQAKLHQESGYLPITRAAYDKTKASGFYDKNPSLQTGADRADQQGADGELPRPQAREHGAAARRLGRGDRGGALGPEAREGRAGCGGRARQHDAAPVRALGQPVSFFSPS